MTIDRYWPQLAGAGMVARHHEPSPDLEDDFVQLGRNLASRCEATFRLLVEAQTNEPALMRAAERGRAEVLARDLRPRGDQGPGRVRVAA